MSNTVEIDFGALTLAIIGIVIIGQLDGYYDALGVFFMLWGNNVAKDL